MEKVRFTSMEIVTKLTTIGFIENAKCYEKITIPQTSSGIIEIKNSEFQSLTIQGRLDKISIKEDCEIDEISIPEDKYSGFNSLQIYDSKIKSIKATSLYNPESIIINNSIFGDLDFYSSNVNNVDIQNSSWNKLIAKASIDLLRLDNNPFSKSHTNHILLEQNVASVNVKSSTVGIKVLENVELKKIELESSRVTSFEIEDTTKKKSCSLFIIKNCNIDGHLNLSGLGFISQFSIESLSYPTELIIENLTIENNFHQCSLANCTINNLLLEKISQKKAFSITKCIINHLTIESCHFDETTKLNQVDLYNCSLKISRTILENVKINSIRWPKDFKISNSNSSMQPELLNNSLDEFEELITNYKQLRILCESHSEKIAARQFLAHEVETFHKLITLRAFPFSRYIYSKGYDFLFVDFALLCLGLVISPFLFLVSYKRSIQNYLSIIGDFLILKTNHIFSGFGLGIWKPFLWMIFIHLLFFWSISPIFDIYFTFDYDLWSIDVFMRGLGYYLQLLSPFHSTEIYSEKEYSRIVDFFMRISSAYFIFYFIKASRKYNFS